MHFYLQGRKAERYASPHRCNRCTLSTRRGAAPGPPWGATTSRCGARAPCSAPSAMALDARQSQLAFLQAQAAVQRFAAASRLERWGRRGALPQTPGQKCRLNFLSALNQSPSLSLPRCGFPGKAFESGSPGMRWSAARHPEPGVTAGTISRGSRPAACGLQGWSGTGAPAQQGVSLNLRRPEDAFPTALWQNSV